MKTFVLFFALFTCWSSSAQLTLNTATNLNAEIRKVDGRHYLSIHDPSWHLYSANVQKQIGGDAVVSATTNRFYVRHFSPESSINGLASFRAMNTGTTNFQGETFQMLDCGVIDTNLVAFPPLKK